MTLADSAQELVAHAPIFGSIQPAKLKKILEDTKAKLVSDSARQLICRREQPNHEVSIIMDGWVMRYDLLPDGRRQIVEFATAGDTIGPIGFAPLLHQYFVQTITPLKRWVLDADRFAVAVRKEPELHRRMTHLAFSALSEREDMLTDLGRRSAPERIARLILRLIARMDRVGLSRGNEYDFPFKQSQIADATGLTAVHVNRTLMNFKKANAIQTQNGKLKIENLDVLLVLAEMSMSEFRAMREQQPH